VPVPPAREVSVEILVVNVVPGVDVVAVGVEGGDQVNVSGVEQLSDDSTATVLRSQKCGKVYYVSSLIAIGTSMSMY